MRRFTAFGLVLILCMGMIGCAQKQGESAPTVQAAAVQAAAVEPTMAPSDEPVVTSTPEPAATAAPTEEPTPEPVSPYNWLGYPEIPQCAYLDAVCAQHYYRVYLAYVDLGNGAIGPVKYTVAADGRNAYEKAGESESYTREGMITRVNTSNKTYRELDMTAAYAALQNTAEQAAENRNTTGKVFQETGTGVIPLIEGYDDGIYAYYQYLTDGSMPMMERLYMKDGDVYAIYTEITMSEKTTMKQTYLNKTMTTEIPDGLVDLPDLTGYEKK